MPYMQGSKGNTRGRHAWMQPHVPPTPEPRKNIPFMVKYHNDKFREVCIQYGVAMYFVQSFEQGVARANFCLDLAPRLKQHVAEIDEVQGKSKESVYVDLGVLLKRLQRITTVPAALIHTLGQARYRRDLLTDRFFRDRAESFFLGKSEDLLQELRGHRKFFHSADKSLQGFMLPLLLRFGFTEESLRSELDAYFTLPDSRRAH